jgi:hypothetical protein
MSQGLVFNPPPGWPKPPSGWVPPRGWTPDPNWPPPPEGWQLWIANSESDQEQTVPPLEIGGTKPASPPSTEDRIAAMDRVSFLEAENRELKKQLEAARTATASSVVMNDDAVLQEVGIYRYHHPLETAADYQERLLELDARIAETVKFGRAIEKSNMFTYDNSLAKGRKMSDDLAKLMLRAYNAEAENSVRSLRAGNVVTAKKRIERSREAIAKLGKMMEMHISEEFHQLRVYEIELTSDFLMKKQQEKEEAREERARLREEKKVAAELAAEREKLDKEKNHILNALEALRSNGDSDPLLEEKLSQLEEAISQNDFRAANIRAGYVYVISNRGAFGANVVKIGLTRRLEPLNRVDELGGASVPFRFDVHGLFFSEDAVTLETELHNYFANRRLNHANARKEFFFASPSEVREVLKSKMGNLLEFTEKAEALDFNQSLQYWPETQRFRVDL